MPRQMSGAAIAAAYAPHTDEAILLLLTLDHDTLPEPIRVTSDEVETVSRGQTWQPYPYRIRLPDARTEAAPTALLEIDNVHRDIIAAIRRMGTKPARVTIELVLGSRPDQVEMAWRGFELREITYDALTVTGELVVADLATTAYPKHRFVPALFPGLF